MAQDDLNAIDQTIENLQNGQKSEVTNKSYWEGKKQQAMVEMQQWYLAHSIMVKHF